MYLRRDKASFFLSLRGIPVRPHGTAEIDGFYQTGRDRMRRVERGFSYREAGTPVGHIVLIDLGLMIFWDSAAGDCEVK